MSRALMRYRGEERTGEERTDTIGERRGEERSGSVLNLNSSSKRNTNTKKIVWRIANIGGPEPGLPGVAVRYSYSSRV